MSDKFHEYGWVLVARDDKQEGDQHFDCGKWRDCPMAGHCDIPRRRRIVAPEAWRVMGIEERILGELQSTLDGISWKTYTGEFVDVPFSTKKITVGDWPGILAIATPIKREVISVPDDFELVSDRTLKIESGWKWASPGMEPLRWTSLNNVMTGMGQLKDAIYSRPVAKTGPNIYSATGPSPKFHWGDRVRKTGGDYTFEGLVVSVFAKLSGCVRYVVEDDRGCLHIYSEKNLEAHGK